MALANVAAIKRAKLAVTGIISPPLTQGFRGHFGRLLSYGRRTIYCSLGGNSDWADWCGSADAAYELSSLLGMG